MGCNWRSSFCSEMAKVLIWNQHWPLDLLIQTPGVRERSAKQQPHRSENNAQTKIRYGVTHRWNKHVVLIFLRQEDFLGPSFWIVWVGRRIQANSQYRTYFHVFSYLFICDMYTWANKNERKDQNCRCCCELSLGPQKRLVFFMIRRNSSSFTWAKIEGYGNFATMIRPLSKWFIKWNQSVLVRSGDLNGFGVEANVKSSTPTTVIQLIQVPRRAWKWCLEVVTPQTP